MPEILDARRPAGWRKEDPGGQQREQGRTACRNTPAQAEGTQQAHMALLYAGYKFTKYMTKNKTKRKLQRSPVAGFPVG
jgi:hypothetical protein